MKNKIKSGLLITICIALLFGTVSSFAVYSNLDAETAASYYLNWTVIGVLVLVAFLACMFVWYRSISSKSSTLKKGKGKSKAESADTKEVRNAVIVIILVGLVVRLILSIPDLGYANDIGCFSYWSRVSAEGFFDTYNNLGANIDYPPGYVYILYATGLIGKIFNCFDTAAYTMIVKLPAIICDCFIAWFIYLIAKNRVSKNLTLFFVVFWVANPAAFIDSTIWGQVDSVLSLALIAGLYLITKEKFVRSSVVFGVAIMLKPQAIIVLPILFYALLKNKKVKTFIFSFLAGVGTAIAVALPFAVNVDMTTEHMQETVTPLLEMVGANGGGFITKLATPFAWIISLFMGTAGHYSYATVNALNFFYMTGANWKQDSEPFMGLTYYLWGMIAIVVAAVLIWVVYIKAKKSEHMPYMAAAALLLMVANFGPRMHERYFFPSLVLLLFAAIIANTRGTAIMAVAATALGYLTVLEILIDLNLGTPYMWPELSAYRFILSLGNVALAAAAAAYVVYEAFGNIENTRFGKRTWKE